MKVIDWGCAKRFGKDKLTDLVGTPYYIAPEVTKRSYDEKCDIWSLGAILYTLLSGEPPFLGETAQEVLDKVNKAEWKMEAPIWGGISAEAKDLLKNMMNPDPAKRFNADQCLMHKWIVSAP